MELKTADVETADDVPVSRLASYEIASVSPQASLLDVVTALVDRDVGIVTVVEDGVTTGVVSERDIIDAVYDGADLAVVWAADVMQANLIHVDPEMTAGAAGLRMQNEGIRHLLVGDPPLGVVSMRDIVGALVGSED
jgi:predicted transcriptional regulator